MIKMIKRTRSRRSKQSVVQPGKIRGKVPNPKAADLPPNKQIDKYADEIYGDTEIPSRG